MKRFLFYIAALVFCLTIKPHSPLHGGQNDLWFSQKAHLYTINYDNLNPFPKVRSTTKVSQIGNRRVDCDPITSLPFTQNFEDLTPPAIPNCGTLANLSNGNNWRTAAHAGNGFNSQVLWYISAYTPAGAAYFTRGISLQANIDYLLQYQYGSEKINRLQNLKIGIAQAPETTAMTILHDFTFSNSHESRIDKITFNVPEDGVYYLVFKVYSEAAQGDLYIDNINLKEAPACQSPFNVTVKNITKNTADVHWDSDAAISSWKIFYGFPEMSMDSVYVEDNPEYTLTGLSAETPYTLQILSVCDAQNESLKTPEITFSTRCEPVAPPFSQNFETLTPPEIPLCATLENAGNGHNWTTFDASQAEENVLNSTVLCYKHDTHNANAWYFTRGITLETGTNYRLIYTYANSTANPYLFEKLRVGYGSLPKPEAIIQQLTDHPHITGGTPFVDTLVFSVEETGTYYFGFNAYSNFNAAYLYVDNLKIEQSPICAKPVAFHPSHLTANSVDLSWESIGDSESWEVVYGASGFTPQNEGFIIDVQTNSQVTINELLPETSYDFYVRSLCVDDSSSFAGPITLTTPITPPENNLLCNAITIPLNDHCADGPYTNIGAFRQPNEPTGSCLFDEPGKHTVWFSFTAPDNGEVTITPAFPETNIQTEMVIYEAPTDCTDLTSLGEEVGCAGYKATIDLHNLTPGAPYYIKVGGYRDSIGQFCIAVKTNENTGVPDFSDFQFYPNPSKNHLYLKAEDPIEGIHIYNLLGKEIILIRPFKQQTQIDTAFLKPGLYIMRIGIDGHTKTFQLLKQ